MEMKTEQTPVCNDDQAWREVGELLGISCTVAKRLERSRRANIRRAWRLRKLNIQRRADILAINRHFALAGQRLAEVTRQRDEAVKELQKIKREFPNGNIPPKSSPKYSILTDQ